MLYGICNSLNFHYWISWKSKELSSVINISTITFTIALIENKNDFLVINLKKESAILFFFFFFQEITMCDTEIARRKEEIESYKKLQKHLEDLPKKLMHNVNVS